MAENAKIEEGKKTKEGEKTTISEKEPEMMAWFHLLPMCLPKPVSMNKYFGTY